MIEYYGYRYIPADTSQYDKTFKYWHLGTIYYMSYGKPINRSWFKFKNYSVL